MDPTGDQASPIGSYSSALAVGMLGEGPVTPPAARSCPFPSGRKVAAMRDVAIGVPGDHVLATGS
jgi:hypothetical protein